MSNSSNENSSCCSDPELGCDNRGLMANFLEDSRKRGVSPYRGKSKQTNKCAARLPPSRITPVLNQGDVFICKAPAKTFELKRITLIVMILIARLHNPVSVQLHHVVNSSKNTLEGTLLIGTWNFMSTWDIRDWNSAKTTRNPQWNLRSFRMTRGLLLYKIRNHLRKMFPFRHTISHRKTIHGDISSPIPARTNRDRAKLGVIRTINRPNLQNLKNWQASLSF
jgi:hypothetical protein